MKHITVFLLICGVIVLTGCSSDDKKEVVEDVPTMDSSVSSEKANDLEETFSDEEQAVVSLHANIEKANLAAQQCFDYKNEEQCKKAYSMMGEATKLSLIVSRDNEAALEAYPEKKELLAEANAMNRNIRLVGKVLMDAIMADAPK